MVRKLYRASCYDRKGVFMTRFVAKGMLALLAVFVLVLSSCATAFYVPSETTLTITVRSTSDFANLDLKGMLVVKSEVSPLEKAVTDTEGQWSEPNGGI